MGEGKEMVEISKEALYNLLKGAFVEGAETRSSYVDGDEGTLAAQEEGWYQSDSLWKCNYFEEV